MVVQPGLCRTWSETPKTGFLATRLILSQSLSRLHSRNSQNCRIFLPLNPLVTINFPILIHLLDKSIFSFWGFRSNFFIFILFFDENHVSKQNRPSWRLIWGYSVCLHSIKRTPGLYWLMIKKSVKSFYLSEQLNDP